MNFAALALVALTATPSLFEPPRSGLVVVAESARSADSIDRQIESAVRQYAKNAAQLTARSRSDLARAGRYHRQFPLSLPLKVYVAGRPAGREYGVQPQGGGITLAFESSGSRAFPTAYQQLLTDTFAQAQSTINLVFGAPALSGTVHVRNYDADIGDRDAVAGGYYVHDNGSGEREIRFPVYTSPEAAAVNFVHTLLLAYTSDKDYGFDAFTEGLVRAATMRIVRTPGALPAPLDGQVVESVLDNTYDVGTFYDWFNQRPLGGAKFIAPNLRSVPLPVGGSLGGIYLARYQMAGTAWQKVLVEYPGFIAAFNQAFYAAPSLQGDIPGLKTLAQTTIDTLAGGPNATVEGLSFADWFVRQNILETRDSLGQKLFVQPVPLPPIGGSTDFGVFLVQATFFETRTGGDEVLLSGTSYPIFWTTNFDRIFPSAQEDVMPISGAYGSVAPNLPNFFGGEPYRTAIDIPILDRISRTYVPAGAVATGANTTENDCYGTVSGVPTGAGVTIRVRLTIGATVFDNIAVTNSAFGTRIDQPIFVNSARVRVEVVRRVASVDTVVIDRLVNKGPGPLALDLRFGNGESSFAFPSGLPKGMALLGLPVDPIANTGGDLLQIAESLVLAARYNSARAAYDIYPKTGAFGIGNGFFVRTETALPGFSVLGRTHPSTPVAVALRPGWNLISAPLAETVSTSRILVVKSTELPVGYAEAAGVELGTTFFGFTAGAIDAATGAPETGTLDAATQFEPGKGYFVRVLVPEGVTLLFEPVSIAAVNRAASATGSPPPVWKVRLQLEDGPFSALAFVGQSQTATAGLDPREDSGLPPSMGGLQLRIEGPETMYQDIRRNGVLTTFKIRAVGLVPGKMYTLRQSFSNGRAEYRFFDPIVGAAGTVRQDWAYRFKARGPEHRFEIQARGGN